MSEEKVGFKALKTWFLFLEEAIFLYYLKKIIIVSYQGENIDEIKLLNEDIPLNQENLSEIENITKLYQILFENPLYYEKIHISVMYNFLRRKGLFLKRYNKILK